MSVQLQVHSHALPELFRDLYQSERTGVLVHRTEGAERRVYFSRGLIQLGESSVAAEGLAARLVRERLVSTGALVEAQKDATGSAAVALALVKRGLIGKDAVHRAARDLVADIVRAIFASDAGTIEFQEQGEVPEIYEADVLSTLSQLLAGIAAMSGFAPIRDAIWSLDNHLRLRRPAPVPLERLMLTRTQGYALSRVDGAASLADVIATLPTEEEESAARFLFALLTLGVIEYDPPLADGPFRAADLLRDHADRMALETFQETMVRQAYARIRVQSPYEVIGVTPHASRASIERAYEEVKSMFSREKLAPRIRERYRGELGVIESRLLEAYLHLTRAEHVERAADNAPRATERETVDVDSLLVRPDMDKTRSRVEKDRAGRVAETYHSKARHAMRSGDYHNAIQYAKLAISYNGEDARLYFLLAECQARNPDPRWQRLAEENYTRAAELDRWNADYWIQLGRFYKKCGMHLRARRQFEEALKVVPEHEVATQELRSLG